MRILAAATLAIALTTPFYAAPKGKPTKPEKPLKAAPVVIESGEPSPKTTVEKPGPVFLELFGSFAFAQGTFPTVEDGQPDAVASDTSRGQKSQNASGFGGGVAVGYDVAENVGLVLGGYGRSLRSRTFTNSNGGGAWTRQSTSDSFAVTLGVRPFFRALGGRAYAGAGWLVTMPFVETTDFKSSSSGAAFTASSDSLKIEDKYNFSLKGMYGELGLNYEITDNLYFGLSARAFVATTDNINQTRVETKNTSGTVIVTTTTYKENASQDNFDATASNSTTTTVKQLSRDWTNKGVTDIAFNFSVGYRF